jgi:hypothetical protein
MRPRSLVTLLAFALVSFGSLGVSSCSDELIERGARILADHEQRIRALERRAASDHVCERPVCGGPDGIACGEGTWCETRPGCDPEAWGYCATIPEACPLIVDPVCGCDGVTYGNDCERRMAGVPLDHRGTCGEVPIGCESNDDCSSAEYCARRVGVCDAHPGTCVARPEACTLHIAPVCGCDGRTYGNDCEAAAAGVSLASRKPCAPPLVPICHLPPGNPGNRHTIHVGESAVPAHLAHGDFEGRCPEPR